jgi:hypothetical protein
MTRRGGLIATATYLVLAVVMTWPLARVIDHEIASDLGDPVFNAWVLLWTGGQLMAFLGGDVTALSRYWHGNIFFPEPLTIAYSEHLAPQMLQALPILAATDNVVLAYNLLFLSTFVLSGLGMFLLVRDITGRPVAALVAGIAFAFAPYRFAQLSHLQVLSAQWMPFVLYGFRRFLETKRRRALVGGSAALVAQNLSCGYYLLFFAPFAGAYVLYELAVRRRLKDWATWRAFGLAAVVVVLVTLPFLLPYLEVRNTGVGVRPLGEIQRFSADTHAFVTPPRVSLFLGERLAGFDKGEGAAFPGAAILLLASVGILVGLCERYSPARVPASLSPWRQVVGGALLVLLVAHLYASTTLLATGKLWVPFGQSWTLYLRAGPTLLWTLVLALSWDVVMRRTREARTPWRFYTVAALVAASLALGPQIAVEGRLISPGPYAWLLDYLPGFDGLRVPARYVMLVTLFLAVLAGIGASALIGRARRWGTICAIAAAVFMLVEVWPGRFPTNVPLTQSDEDSERGLEVAAGELRVGRDIPPIYKVIRDSPGTVVLIEFPFGDPAWDLHSVFYAGYHRQKLVNGFSGFFPDSQQHLIEMLNWRTREPETAWRAVSGSGATHALVHEAAFSDSRGRDLIDWLFASGAREILVDGTDHLFTLR